MTRGFFLSGMYNPWIEWDILGEEYIRAITANEEGDVEPLKAFNNTRLGLLHEEIGDRVEADLYNVRREVYEAEIPDGVIVLTAGVDLGERQINYEVVGWGRGKQSWGIEYGILDGDWREDDIWKLLDEAVFNRAFVTKDGKKMRVRRMAVDSGYAAEFVYRYTKPRQPRAISIKGEGGLGKPLIKGAGTLTKSNAARLITLGVDTGKEEIVNRLRVAKVGPGYCHFPKLKNNEPARGYDEEYFKGLTAERRLVKSKFGFKTYQWVKRLSQRNEPFDCRNYAMACLAMRWAGIDLENMKRDEYEPPQKGSGQFGAQQVTMVSEGKEGSQSGPTKFGAANRPVE